MARARTVDNPHIILPIPRVRSGRGGDGSLFLLRRTRSGGGESPIEETLGDVGDEGFDRRIGEGGGCGEFAAGTGWRFHVPTLRALR